MGRMKNEDGVRDWRFERGWHQDDDDWYNGLPGRESSMHEISTIRESQATSNQALLLTVEEAARLLGVGRTMMFDLIGRGDIKSVRLGRRRLIARRSLEAFVDDLSTS
jgi:excisionase family DNA binding protein